MPGTNAAAIDLRATYLQLSDGPAVDRVPVGDDFWQRIDERTELHSGRLMTVFGMQQGRTHWEMHPAGDEIIVVTQGAVTLVLREQGGDRRVDLACGLACIVPQGVWHMFEARADCQLIAITRGAGTEHRAHPPADEEKTHG